MNYTDQILNSTEQPQCHQRLRWSAVLLL